MNMKDMYSFYVWIEELLAKDHQQQHYVKKWLFPSIQRVFEVYISTLCKKDSSSF